MGNKSKNSSKIFQYMVPALGDVLFAIFFYTTCFFGQKLLGDCDTGYHIRAGECIIKTLSIPRYDTFSCISPPLPWTAHEWLSEVIMTSLHSLLGLPGVVVFFAGMISLVYYLLFRMLRRLNGYILIAVAMTLLTITSSMLHWLARPHIFSLLFMVVWYDLLDSYQYRGINRLCLFPFLMLLWVNLHGGFIIGFVLLGIYSVGNLWLSRFGAMEERETARCRWRYLLMITLFCLAASLVNPFGYNILLFPFSLVSNRYMMDNVMEFLSPNFHEIAVTPFRLLLLLTLGLWAFSRRRPTIIEVSLLLLFLNLSLYSVRYIPLFTLIAAPIVARVADRLLDENSCRFAAWLRRKDAGIAEIDGQARGFIWPIIITLIIVPYFLQSGASLGFDEKLKPVAAVEFMKREQIPGNMFNNDEFGDYIIYAAWPQYHVFVDGRLDMYGSDLMKEYNKVVKFDADWESVMKKYDMNWIIYDADSPLCRYLLIRNDWRLIYADKVADVFVRNIPLYGPLIRKYPAVKPVSSVPTPL